METWNRLIVVGGEKGGNSGRRGRSWLKNMYERFMDMDNGEGIDCGECGWLGGRGQKEKRRKLG